MFLAALVLVTPVLLSVLYQSQKRPFLAEAVLSTYEESKHMAVRLHMLPESCQGTAT